MTEYEQRRDIMALAAMLDEKRKGLQDVLNDIKYLSAQLVAHADGMLPAAAETSPENRSTVVGRITYNVPRVSEPVLDARVVAQAGKRACSVCGARGHRKTTCPKAHEVQAEKKEVATTLAVRAAAKAVLKGTGKRACSNCHMPGHRAKNCTEPIVLKRKRGKK